MIAAATPLAAQSSPAGPLALLLPVSARSGALGNAWVAGRDEYAIFFNPAAVQTAAGIGASFSGYGSEGRSLAAVSSVVVGPATIGWGVHLVDFSTPRSNTAYPYAPATVTGEGDADLFSMVALVAARITHKGFQIGLAGKYSQDVVAREASTSSSLVLPLRGATVLADVGTTHALWTGTAGLAVQNIAAPYSVGGQDAEVPTQIALGWTKVRTLGPLDFGFAGQTTLRRHGWVGVGAGLDFGWAWIDGYNVGWRVGARRTETDDERPLSLGATFTADRLNFDYGIGFFANDKYVHRLTVRWR
jgi:hypothetical protein